MGGDSSSVYNATTVYYASSSIRVGMTARKDSEVVCINDATSYTYGVTEGRVYTVTQIAYSDARNDMNDNGPYYRLLNDHEYHIWYHHSDFISARKAKLSKLYDTLQQGR